MRRRLLTILAGLFASLAIAVAGASGASAATIQPTPESPLSVSGSNAFVVQPNPLPDPNMPFNENDLLTKYGTAGPFWVTYDLGAFETVGAQMWVELANNGLNNSKMVLSGAASFAGWVFNPGSLLDQLAEPADSTAKTLNDSVVAQWLPFAILIVTALLVWAARKGKVGLSVTRVLYVLAGLALIGAGAANPSNYARGFSNIVSDTVASVLVPKDPPPNIQSDADAKAYAATQTAEGKARTRAQVGTKMLGPLYRVAVYDRWADGMFGSKDNQTAKSHAAAMFQDQALTWNEATKPDGGASLVDAKKKDWSDNAAQIEGGDKINYPNVQGSRASLGPVIASYMIIAACLPFLIAAMVLVLACYMGLFLLAALSPIIGLAVIFYPRVLGKVGEFALGIIVNGMVYAVAAAVILKLSTGLLAASNLLLAIIVTAVLSYLAWKLLKPFRQFGEGSVAARVNQGGADVRHKVLRALGVAGGAVGETGESRRLKKQAGEEAEKQKDGAPAPVEALPEAAPAQEYPKPPATPTVAASASSGSAPPAKASGEESSPLESEPYIPERVASMEEYRSKHGTTATTNGRAVVVVGQPDNEDEEAAPSTADRAATPSAPAAEHPHQDAPEEYSYAVRRRPAAERVIYNPATGRNEQVADEDGAPSAVIARADTPTEESA